MRAINAGMSPRTSSARTEVIAEETGALPVFALRPALFFCLDFKSIDKFLIVYTLQRSSLNHSTIAPEQQNAPVKASQLYFV
jgi:hypothetical protein